VADVIVAPDDGGYLARAVSALDEQDHDNVLPERGPGIAVQLGAGDLFDEVCLTASPLVVGGDARRILDGGALDPARRLELGGVLTADGDLFLRCGRQ
jgi:riboflavin biosynthesis pyrimidine reductase